MRGLLDSALASRVAASIAAADDANTCRREIDAVICHLSISIFGATDETRIEHRYPVVCVSSVPICGRIFWLRIVSNERRNYGPSQMADANVFGGRSGDSSVGGEQNRPGAAAGNHFEGQHG